MLVAFVKRKMRGDQNVRPGQGTGVRPPAVPWHIVRTIVVGMLAPNWSDKSADNRTETVGTSALAIEQEHTTITARSYGRDADIRIQVTVSRHLNLPEAEFSLLL